MVKRAAVAKPSQSRMDLYRRRTLNHEEPVEAIKGRFEYRFSVSTRNNTLPMGAKREEAVYRPDIIIRDKVNKEIVYIVEVETSDKSGKSIVEATILADYCVGIEHQITKPVLIFVFLGREPDIHLANKRIDKIAAYLKNLQKPQVFSYSNFIPKLNSFIF